MINLLRVALVCAVLCFPVLAQQTNPPGPLPPGAPPVPLPRTPASDSDVPATPAAAYQFAMQPVDVVRRSPDNMSDAERYAWEVAIVRAARSCVAVKAANFNGEELYSLAQLCALGKQYPPSIEAVKLYLASENPKNPELARALWARTALQMADGSQAQRVTEQLIDMYPYDAVVHSVSQDVMMALAGPDEAAALALGIRRFPALLNAIGTGKPLTTASGDFELPVSTLFRDALKLAAIYKHRGDDREADSLLQQIAAKLQVVGAQVPQAQHHEIDVAVKHFLMLGQPASAIDYSRRVPKSQNRAAATLPTKGKTTVLLFYTSWCAQCFKAMAALPRLRARYGGKANGYAVTTPDVFGAVKMQPAAIEKALAVEFKAETAGVSMLVASDDARRAFAVDDYPMLLIIGPSGNVQFLDEIPHDGFQPRGYLDRMLRRLTGTPPPAEPEQRSPKSPSHAN